MDYTVEINSFLFYNLFILLIIPCLLLFKSKFLGKEFNQNYFTKENSNIWKGLAVLLIFLGHLTQRFENHNILFPILVNAGLFGVIIFLFVSGYGTMVQYRNKENYLSNKYFTKIGKLLLMFIICNIFVSVGEVILFHQQYDIERFITSILTFSFCNGRTIWFLVIIIYNYITFYIIMKYSKLKWLVYFTFIPYVLVLKIAGFGNWWYNSAISFPIGIYVAENQAKILKRLKSKYYIQLVLGALLFLILIFLYQSKNITIVQYLFPIILIYLVVLVSLKFKLNSNFFEMLNKYSFEIYLIQPFFMDLIFHYFPNINSILIIIILFITVLISIFIHNMIKLLYKFGGLKK